MATDVCTAERVVVATDVPPLIVPVLEPPQETSGQTGEMPPTALAVGPLAVGETVTLDTSERTDPIETAAVISEQAETDRQITVNDFDEIFTRFQGPITNFVYRMVGNRDEANDLAQDTFVKVYLALEGGESVIREGALSSWLYRIASNAAIDALRRRRRIKWLPMSLFDDDRGIGAGIPNDDDPSSRSAYIDSGYGDTRESAFHPGDGGRFEEKVALTEIIQTVLGKMRPVYATCLLLYEHEGYSCKEIAGILGITPSAVKMRLMRGREHFIAIYHDVTRTEAKPLARSRTNTLARYVRDVLGTHDRAVMSGRRKSPLGQVTVEGI